jgi:hypothetical protein
MLGLPAASEIVPYAATLRPEQAGILALKGAMRPAFLRLAAEGLGIRSLQIQRRDIYCIRSPLRFTAGPPRVLARGVLICAVRFCMPKKRAAFYFDGFNLYHALDGLRQQHLK